MNEKFNDLMKKIRASATVAGEFAVKTANTAGKKANEVFNVSKCNLSIFDLNTDVDVLYKEIGRLIYQSHCNEETSSEELEAKLTEVDEKMRQIEELKAKITEMKDADVCSNCGNTVSKDAQFCPRCGEKMSSDTEQ